VQKVNIVYNFAFSNTGHISKCNNQQAAARIKP